MKRVCTAMACALTLLVSVAGPADAALSPDAAVVSADPADTTPRVIANTGGGDTAVYKMAEIGGTMFAGGEFTQIQDAGRTSTYNRKNLFSFDPVSGAVNALSATFDGPVWAITSDGTSLYVGGTFSTVNGVPRRGIVKMDAVTGVVDPAFSAALDGPVREAQVVAGRLIVGGEFTKRLMAVNLATGADTGYLNVAISGDVDGAGEWVPRVYRFAVNRTGTQLAAVGNFRRVNGEVRPRAFLLDLGPSAATLNPWSYAPLGRPCAAPKLADYLRDVAFSPNGAWFVIVSSGSVPRKGSEIGTSVCDAAARFETANPAPTRPTWINYTGGDTLQSVIVAPGAVYVQGHNRWLDNASGRDTCVAPCVSRPGIGAIDPTSGRALPWNPTKDRGEGGKDLLLTSQGLWVASDTTTIGGETHERVALMPAG